MRWLAIVVALGCGGRSTPPLANVATGASRATSVPPESRAVLIDHLWPVPPALPALPSLPPRGRGASVPIMIAASPLPSPLTVATAAERPKLRRVVVASRGTAAAVARIEALEQIALSLEDEAQKGLDRDPPVLDETATAAAYRELLRDPALDAFARADEILLRAARSMIRADDDAAAKQALDRLVTRFPGSRYVAAAYLQLGDTAYYAKDYATAKAAYLRALALPTGAATDQARYRLGWTHHQIGEHDQELAAFVLLAASPQVHDLATASMVEPYAEIGRADIAFAMFSRIEPSRARVLELMRSLAERYAELGRSMYAVAALRMVISIDHDRAATCLDHVELLEVQMIAGSRATIETAVGEVAAAVPTGGGARCAAAADEVVGTLAWTWHHELPRSEADRPQVLRMWGHAVALATTPERRAVALYDRAILAWEIAHPERRSAAWITVAIALQRAAAASVTPGELSAAATDAWDNAIRLGLDESQLRIAREGLRLLAPAIRRARVLLGRLP